MERNVKGIGCEVVDWIKLAKEETHVNTAIKLQKMGSFMIN
jgi:hypothetical protein